MEPSLADGKTTKIHQTLQMQHGLKLCTVVNGSKDPLICKEDTGSCLNRLCDAKHSKFWKMWRYLKKGQKVFSWCDHCWGLGSRVKPIFRRSNSSSALLVISFTFALAPLQTVCKVYFAINLLRYSIQRASISSIAGGRQQCTKQVFQNFFLNFLSKIKLFVVRTVEYSFQGLILNITTSETSQAICSLTNFISLAFNLW